VDGFAGTWQLATVLMLTQVTPYSMVQHTCDVTLNS